MNNITNNHLSAEQRNNFYSNWCKETKRNGGTLIGKSIDELMIAFEKHLADQSTLHSEGVKSGGVSEIWNGIESILYNAMANGVAAGTITSYLKSRFDISEKDAPPYTPAPAGNVDEAANPWQEVDCTKEQPPVSTAEALSVYVPVIDFKGNHDIAFYNYELNQWLTPEGSNITSLVRVWLRKVNG